MIIERTNKEIIIRLPSTIPTEELQQFVDFLIYKEATLGSKAQQKDVDRLANEAKMGWWKKNRNRFIK